MSGLSFGDTSACPQVHVGNVLGECPLCQNTIELLTVEQLAPALHRWKADRSEPHRPGMVEWWATRCDDCKDDAREIIEVLNVGHRKAGAGAAVPSPKLPAPNKPEHKGPPPFDFWAWLTKGER